MARPKLPAAKVKDEILTLRLTKERREYLDEMADRITADTGFKVSARRLPSG